MLKTMTIAQALENFIQFWEKYFPEQHWMDRGEALAKVDDAKSGLANVDLKDQEMTGYHDAVAQVYGAYEMPQFQLATMEQVVKLMQKIEDSVNIVSLGCGPASYELWLLAHSDHRATLVDLSAGMLKRASETARDLGISDRVTFIQNDARTVPSIPSQSADVVLCFNSMHWSAFWREWISELARIAKPNAASMITCSLFAPRSQITPESLAIAMRQFLDRPEAGTLTPPSLIGSGLATVSTRMYVIGHRIDPKQKKKEKKQRQREQKRNKR